MAILALKKSNRTKRKEFERTLAEVSRNAFGWKCVATLTIDHKTYALPSPVREWPGVVARVGVTDGFFRVFIIGDTETILKKIKHGSYATSGLVEIYDEYREDGWEGLALVVHPHDGLSTHDVIRHTAAQHFKHVPLRTDRCFDIPRTRGRVEFRLTKEAVRRERQRQ